MIEDAGISVVVASFNTRGLLDACLASLLPPGALRGDGQSERGLEVIVVDNGSHDGSGAMVRTKYPQARLMEMGRNLGFARACNAGMRASRGRCIVLLNSDTVVLDSAMSHLAAFLDEHPQYAVAGPLLLNRDGSVQPSCFAFTSVRDILFEQLGLTALFPHSARFNRRGLGDFNRSTARAVDWVSGACLMVRRAALDQVGPLDEGFFMYGEELDWCYRMKQAGLQAVFVPAARVIHLGRASSMHALGELAPRALAGRLRYFQKHHGAAAVLAVRALTVLGMTLRLIVLPVRSLWRRRPMRAEWAWYWGLLRGALAPLANPHVEPLQASTQGEVQNG